MLDLRYDPESRSGFVRLREGQTARTRELSPNAVAEYGRRGQLLAITLDDIEVFEMHEAFAAQVLSNIQWMGSKKIAEEKLGRKEPIGEIDPEKINRTGGSIALGHPFGATGARIVTTVCNELQRTGEQYGLVTVCAAGGMGAAMVLERE
jgi:acetyl-CoA acyltransferase